MMRAFHELRRHEEGQALVLAAISMLILSICVLATVNITFAAKEKIRLQNAADAGAYATAAYEARALNFFAYTNRAMVVHYSSMMNMMAVLSYLTFARAVLNLLSYIPYIGFIFKIWEMIVMVFQILIEIAAIIGIPMLDGCNLLLGVTQFAVSGAMMARAALVSPSEVTKYNPAYQSYPLAGIAGGMQWFNAVKTPLLTSFLGSLLGLGASDADKLDRAFMTEVVNSSRNRWTADGSPNGTSFTAAGIPRKAAINVGLGPFGLRFGKIARTEYGSYSPGSGGFMGLWKVTDEVYSIDQLVFELKVFSFKLTLTISAVALADRKLGHHAFDGVNLKPKNCGKFDFVCKFWSKIVVPAIAPMVNQALQSVLPAGSGNHKLHFHFGQMPYTTFKTKNFSGTKWFNQPATVLVVTMPEGALTAMGKPFIGKFGGNLGLSSQNSRLTGTGDISKADNKRTVATPKSGYRTTMDFNPGTNTFLTLPRGLHAVSAAVAYYHRPGDWREPPNLFNPFWGAKLLPVADHPLVGANPLLKPLLAGAPATRLLVH